MKKLLIAGILTLGAVGTVGATTLRHQNAEIIQPVDTNPTVTVPVPEKEPIKLTEPIPEPAAQPSSVIVTFTQVIEPPLSVEQTAKDTVESRYPGNTYQYYCLDFYLTWKYGDWKSMSLESFGAALKYVDTHYNSFCGAKYWVDNWGKYTPELP